MVLLVEIEFGSLFSYVPRQEGKRRHPAAYSFVNPTLKQDKMMPEGCTATEYVARELKNASADLPFSGFFGEDVYLVPAPSSAKHRTGALRVTLNLANALAKKGFGIVMDCLERTEPVQKSAYGSGREHRLIEQHHKTIKVTRSVFTPVRVVIVDDVVTTGATLLACASRIREVWPEASVAGFAAVRTVSAPGADFAFEDARRGTIVLDGGYAKRIP